VNLNDTRRKNNPIENGAPYGRHGVDMKLVATGAWLLEREEHRTVGVDMKLENPLPASLLPPLIVLCRFRTSVSTESPLYLGNACACVESCSLNDAEGMGVAPGTSPHDGPGVTFPVSPSLNFLLFSTINRRAFSFSFAASPTPSPPARLSLSEKSIPLAVYGKMYGGNRKRMYNREACTVRW
jgi:hypothetical protein